MTKLEELAQRVAAADAAQRRAEWERDQLQMQLDTAKLVAQEARDAHTAARKAIYDYAIETYGQ